MQKFSAFRLMNYPRRMDKNTCMVVGTAIFIWVTRFISLCNRQTQTLLAIWRTFLILTHLQQRKILLIFPVCGPEKQSPCYPGILPGTQKQYIEETERRERNAICNATQR